MKRFSLAIIVCIIMAACASAYAQMSNLLAKCLGEPLTAYQKAFVEKVVSDEKTPHGNYVVGDYKTSSARIVVKQKAGDKKASVVNVFFYQEPKRDWKLALKDLGMSTAGVIARVDAKHWVHLSHIKGPKAVRIEAVYVPLGSANPNGPELHMTLR